VEVLTRHNRYDFPATGTRCVPREGIQLPFLFLIFIIVYRGSQLPQPPFASTMLWVAGHPMQSSYREGVSHEVLTKCDEIEIKKFNHANKGGFYFVF
jgi:hypothetical protein